MNCSFLNSSFNKLWFLGHWLRALNTCDRVFALEGCTWWWGRWAVHRAHMRLGGRTGRNVISIDGRLCKKTSLRCQLGRNLKATRECRDVDV